MSSKERIEAKLEEIDRNLEALATHLQSTLDRPLSETLAELEPLESAKLQVSLAYAMNTLFYMYMRLQGVAISDHPIHKDLERIKSYIEKIKEAENDKTRRETSRVNAQAAQRFIRNALWEVGSSSSNRTESTETEGLAVKEPIAETEQ